VVVPSLPVTGLSVTGLSVTGLPMSMTGRLPAGVVTGMSVADVSMNTSVMTDGMAVSDYVMGARVVPAKTLMSAVFSTGIVADMSRDHAENHVAEAQHGTDDIKSSERS